MNLGCYLDSDLQPPPPGCCNGGPGPSLGDAQVGGGGVGALVNGTVKPAMTSPRNGLPIFSDFFHQHLNTGVNNHYHPVCQFTLKLFFFRKKTFYLEKMLDRISVFCKLCRTLNLLLIKSLVITTKLTFI